MMFSAHGHARVSRVSAEPRRYLDSGRHGDQAANATAFDQDGSEARDHTGVRLLIRTKWLEPGRRFHLGFRKTWTILLTSAAPAARSHGSRSDTSAPSRRFGNSVSTALTVLYPTGVGLAFVHPWLGLAVYIGVALIWFLPNRRVEDRLIHDEHRDQVINQEFGKSTSTSAYSL
jgi:hypothetical protein